MRANFLTCSNKTDPDKLPNFNLKNINTNNIYSKIQAELSSAGVCSPAFESFLILKHVFNKHFLDLEITDISDSKLDSLKNILIKRKSGVPLQYILGSWEFWSLCFKVGEGVLIPRSETELLVETALLEIKNKKKPVVIDLCSGSGCVAIAIAKERPDAKVLALEKSEKAFEYLISNIQLNKIQNILPICADVLNQSALENHSNALENIKFDLIVSNPPYIKTNELNSLQKEVQNEPKMALDGGENGLFFYQKISEIWKKKLKPKAPIAFEIGAGQEQEVTDILKKNNFTDIILKQDLNRIYRVICGKTK